MRRIVLLALVLATTGTARAADELGFEDLGAAGEVDEASEAKIQAHLKTAHALMGKGDYPAARRELDAADAIVPMHEAVMDALEQLGDLEDESRKSAELVGELEKERAQKDIEKAHRSGQRQKVDAEVDKVLRKHRLSRRLDLAIVALRERRENVSSRRDAAQQSRDKCIAAAALAHAPEGARRCKDAEAVVDEAKGSLRSIDADLAVLTTTYRDREGQAALDRLLGD